MPTTKEKINEGFEKNLTNVALPTVAKEKIQKDFTAKQDEYATKIVNAFSSSIHRIFIVAGATMLVALFLSTLIVERPLRSANPEETPGE